MSNDALHEACAPYEARTVTPLKAARKAHLAAQVAPDALWTRQSLIDLRRRHKLTQGDLAAALGLTRDRLNDWENGRSAISPEGRKLLWLVSGLLDGTAPRTLFELSTWNRYRYRKPLQKP